MSGARNVIGALRQPEYVGENRCLPCTVVNAVIAVAASVVVAVVSPPLGAVVLATSAALIYLRGYLVPGTPTLTKRYLPRSVLRLFGKVSPTIEGTPDADVGAVGSAATGDDALELVLATGVVTECEDVDDLCLRTDFRETWRRHLGAARGDEAVQLAYVADALELDPDELSVNDDLGTVTLHGEAALTLGEWTSREAFVADAAAAAALDEATAWDGVPVENRGAVLAGLRLFLERCPNCDAALVTGEETVESCCFEREVVSVRCEECGVRLLELDAPTEA